MFLFDFVAMYIQTTSCLYVLERQVQTKYSCSRWWKRGMGATSVKVVLCVVHTGPGGGNGERGWVEPKCFLSLLGLLEVRASRGWRLCLAVTYWFSYKWPARHVAERIARAVPHGLLHFPARVTALETGINNASLLGTKSLTGKWDV